MKKLRTLKYILFSLIVFGCFANFAQNEYGIIIIKLSLAALAIIFFIEALKGKIHEKSNYLFMDSLFISLFISGFIFKWQHWPGAGIMMVIAGSGLTVIYVNEGMTQMKNGWKSNPKMSILISAVFVAVSLGFIGGIFNLQHWPGANAMLRVNMFLLPIIGLLSLIKFRSQGESLRTIKYLRKFKGNIFLFQVIFTIMVMYLGLRVVDVAPSFYSLTVPKTMDKLRLDAEITKGEKEEAIYEKYVDDYFNFIRRRKEAQELDR